MLPTKWIAVDTTSYSAKRLNSKQYSASTCTQYISKKTVYRTLSPTTAIHCYLHKNRWEIVHTNRLNRWTAPRDMTATNLLQRRKEIDKSWILCTTGVCDKWHDASGGYGKRKRCSKVVRAWPKEWFPRTKKAYPQAFIKLYRDKWVHTIPRHRQHKKVINNRYTKKRSKRIISTKEHEVLCSKAIYDHDSNRDKRHSRLHVLTLVDTDLGISLETAHLKVPAYRL